MNILSISRSSHRPSFVILVTLYMVCSGIKVPTYKDKIQPVAYKTLQDLEQKQLENRLKLKRIELQLIIITNKDYDTVRPE